MFDAAVNDAHRGLVVASHRHCRLGMAQLLQGAVDTPFAHAQEEHAQLCLCDPRHHELEDGAKGVEAAIEADGLALLRHLIEEKILRGTATSPWLREVRRVAVHI